MTTTNYAVAPGEYLEEWIEDNGLSQQDAADRLGYSRKHVNEIVNGRAPITADTAARLQRVVGIPADAWLRYEAAYRADLARIADEEHLADHFDDIHPSAATYLRSLGATTATKREPGKFVSDFLAAEEQASVYQEQRDAVESRLELAARTVADAPHADSCVLGSPYIGGFVRVRVCDCWKAAHEAAKAAI